MEVEVNIDKIIFNPKMVTRDKEGQNIKGSVHQEDEFNNPR